MPEKNLVEQETGSPGCKEDSRVEMQRLCLKHTKNEDLFKRCSRAWGTEIELESQLNNLLAGGLSQIT